MDIELSKEQQNVHDAIISWLEHYEEHGETHVTLGGLAGTGKTTLLSKISETIASYGYVKAFCTFTGKASIVLKRKMDKNGILYDYCGTIHSMIYKPILDKKGNVKEWVSVSKWDVPFDVIFIDEASMVSLDIWDDLLKYNIPIICVGDHGQLPPVSKHEFNLVESPDIRLETIHRQALDNPIIKLSMMARNGEFIEYGSYGEFSHKFMWSQKVCNRLKEVISLDNDVIFLCNSNKTRVAMNMFIRGIIKFDDSFLNIGERIICLRNNKLSGIMNGQLSTVQSWRVIENDFIEVLHIPDGSEIPIMSITHKKFFNEPDGKKINDLANDNDVRSFMGNYPYKKIDIFDYGYCVTVHKSQGSEWNTIFLIDERNYYMTDDIYNRWLYTGITRASHKLYIIGNYSNKYS